MGGEYWVRWFQELISAFLQIHHFFWLVWEHLGLTRGWREGLCISTQTAAHNTDTGDIIKLVTFLTIILAK